MLETHTPMTKRTTSHSRDQMKFAMDSLVPCLIAKDDGVYDEDDDVNKVHWGPEKFGRNFNPLVTNISHW